MQEGRRMHTGRIILSFAFTLFFLTLGTLVHKTTVAVNTNYTTFSTATVYVDPQTSMGATGQNFTIKINISNVIDLYGWEFKLGWNATLLDAVDIKEGSFLKGGNHTFFTFKANNTAGYIIADCTLLGDISGVSGNGTLAIVSFYVETRGGCVLDLYDTILVSSTELPIEHETIDGYVNSSLPPPSNADVDKNGRVDMTDVIIVVNAFGSTPGKPNWDERADIDENCKVDMRDIVIVCYYFGTHI